MFLKYFEFKIHRSESLKSLLKKITQLNWCTNEFNDNKMIINWLINNMVITPIWSKKERFEYNLINWYKNLELHISRRVTLKNVYHTRYHPYLSLNIK